MGRDMGLRARSRWIFPPPSAGEGTLRSRGGEGQRDGAGFGSWRDLPYSVAPLSRLLLTQGAPSPAEGKGRARGRFAYAFLAVLALAAPAHAVQPDEVLKDPVLEHRAREISSELRCLVCQNQSIDDSDAPLAKDLRVIVRERLQKGDTDPAVLRYVVDRYGEFVLLRPVFALHTLLLWLTPILAVLLGAFGIWRLARRRPAAPVRTLSAAEEAEVAALLRRE